MRFRHPLNLLLSCAALLAATGTSAQTVRLKDLGHLSSWRDNALVGYGLVTGLAGTGDSSRSKATRQSIANMLSRFDVVLPSDDINSRNVAAVMITASLPALARPGDRLDAVVTSIGDARSLAGGTLILAPLKAANGKVYSLAQGSLTVGGYRYDANGNQVQKNHPTVGLLSGGAVVESGVPAPVPGSEALTFVLNQSDYTTAVRIAEAINGKLGAGTALVRDGSAIELSLKGSAPDTLPVLLARMESLSVVPDQRATVVINERTGTVVAGGDVQLAPITVSHGDLKVTVETVNDVSQPLLVRNTSAGVQTQSFANSSVDVQEGASAVYARGSSSTVADLVQALSRMKTNTRDVIAILQALKAAGAMHAELIIQ